MNGDQLFLLVWSGLAATTLGGLMVWHIRRPREERVRRARQLQAKLAAIARPANAHPLSAIMVTKVVPGIAFSGELVSGRGALVTYTPVRRDDTLLHPPRTSVELLAPSAPRISIRRRGLLDRLGLFQRNRVVEFGKFVGFSLDHEAARRAFEHSPELAREVQRAFDDFGLEHLIIWDGKLQARSSRSLQGKAVLDLLALLERIVAAFEPVPLAVKVFGGERRALRGFEGKPRCACCHDDITGEEPDLVACERCQTVLHESCWSDLGRCPVLGCEGHSPERPERARA